MESRGNSDTETVAFRLRHELGPYATKFAEHALENRMCDEGALEELLVKEWRGAVPDSFITHEEASRTLMGVLHMFLDFAVENAMRQKDFSSSGANVSYYAEPYYDDSSAVLVVDRETRTLLSKKYIKTYRLDRDSIEAFLENLVGEICGGIDLVRKRKKGGGTLEHERVCSR
ncbi:hypothetical protein AKJ41_03755 [candidate division MSBL1 archaeon SCGC-AAA259O05]|uniref:Uncharacterized protein n=1 Tax=candidate division MSBL1 archaeon SCGC-AAA259O05 TaxID=1698271 RepID=A0A133V2P6_9EURY|nr:hypothetical protein AKJ41_03755 [candidate division MSBL1 archaeon SCGC-AAA259O05]